MDAVYQNLGIAMEKVDVLESLGLVKGGYFLAIAHHAENVDDTMKLSGILEGFRLVHEEFGMHVVFLAPPRTVKIISEFGFGVTLHSLLIMQLSQIGLSGFSALSCELKAPTLPLTHLTVGLLQMEGVAVRQFVI